jgi:hypothetical protein
VNRLLGGAALLLTMLAAVPARGQEPLVVGSVRDQRGVPVVGAVVSGQSPAGVATATTDAAGTFALHGSGIVAVTVRCRYCLAIRVPVTPEQPVVAIVRRFAALVDDAPSPADLQNLPYAHVESAIALRPFTLLAQTTAAYPGPSLSDRGLSASGSLLIDNGTPNYDIVSGASPYQAIPAYYQQSATLRDASNAYLYGNQAAGGIVALEPFLNGSSQQVATIGSDLIARLQAGSDTQAIAAGTFSNNDESRQRTDIDGTWPIGGDQSISFAGGTQQGRDFETPGAFFANSFSFAGATFNAPRALNLTLSAVTDRGNYAQSEDEYPISEAWSDSDLSAGIHTTGAIAGFANVGVRSSSGFYDPQALPDGLPRLAATLVQTRADAGFEASGTDYDVTAGVGTFWIDYAGGSLGVSQPARTAVTVPSLNAQLFPNGKWSLNLQGSGSFTLPTFVEQYLYTGNAPVPVADERNTLAAGELTYTDDARLRVALEGASQSTNGAWSGTVSSAGLSAIWQVAPDIAVRAWTMHVSDTVPLYGGGQPYNGNAPTVAALWLTYDTPSALRVDLIYRRDLLDALPFYHIDGAISGPIANGLRWYAGAEDRMQRTFVDVGIRFIGR